MEPVAVERALASYYDQEGADRAERALAPGREAARARFLAECTRPGMRSLEVGSGGGQDAAAFVAAGLEAFAVDLSPVFAGFTARRGAHPSNATARALPFRDDAFDVVWSMSVLMHIPDDGIGEAMQEIRRVLRPGGVACIGVWGGTGTARMLPGQYGDRFFANRTRAAWTAHLQTVGEVVTYEEWEPDPEGFAYHWALIRRTI